MDNLYIYVIEKEQEIFLRSRSGEKNYWVDRLRNRRLGFSLVVGYIIPKTILTQETPATPPEEKIAVKAVKFIEAFKNKATSLADLEARIARLSPEIQRI